MSVDDNSTRLQLLRNILIYLSLNEINETENLLFISNALRSIYVLNGSDTWRHSHSVIFQTIVYIKGSMGKTGIQLLGRSIEIITKWNNGGKFDFVIQKPVEKLCDHVQLDLARIDFITSSTYSSETMYSEMQSQLDDFSRQFTAKKEELNTTYKKLKNEIKQGQRETITILGIFAAIVISFTGGLVFSTSVLENINKASINRLIVVICGIGFVLFNLVWALLEFIRSLNDRKIKRSYFWWMTNGILFVSMIIALWCPSLGNHPWL